MQITTGLFEHINQGNTGRLIMVYDHTVGDTIDLYERRVKGHGHIVTGRKLTALIIGRSDNVITVERYRK